jgi:hypothetical protein
MLTVGVALFATFSGFLANTFLSAKKEVPPEPNDSDLDVALREIERLHAQQQRALESLRAQMAELGRAT